MKKILALLPALVSSAALAGEATLRLSDDAVSVLMNPTPTQTNSVQFGLRYNDDEDAFMLSGGLFANGRRDAFSGRLGGKLYYADLDHDSGYGVALGGDFTFNLATDLTLNAGAFYGPGSLTFSDLDGYEEWFVRVNYRVFDTARLGAGFGSLQMEPDHRGKDIELDDGFFIEMNLRFM